MNDLTQCVLTPDVNTDGFASLGVAVHRASTIVFENAEAYASRGKRGPDGYLWPLWHPNHQSTRSQTDGA